MRRAVVTFGVISGVVSAGLLLASVPFMDRIGFDRGAIVGYSAMVLAFLFVYFGIRSFRDREQAGAITFSRALAVGLMITVVSCCFYVAAWEFIYFRLTPDFGKKYASYAVEQYRASGASAEAVEKMKAEMADFSVKYDQPLYNASVTFLEPLPVGVLVTVISAVLLRRKRRAA